MRIKNSAFINAVSMGASFNSNPVACPHAGIGSIQLRWTGTPVGNFTIQVSNDLGTQVDGDAAGTPVITNWTTLSGSSQAAGGASGDYLYNFDAIGWLWTRVVYTRTSSTGTADGRFNLKGF